MVSWVHPLEGSGLSEHRVFLVTAGLLPGASSVAQRLLQPGCPPDHSAPQSGVAGTGEGMDQSNFEVTALAGHVSASKKPW